MIIQVLSTLSNFLHTNKIVGPLFIGVNLIRKINGRRHKILRKGSEVPNGWPFGLGSMSTRLGVTETTEAVVGATESNTLHDHSSSFSSFSSSNFDTESTTSFFQDKSVSPGRLIGIRPLDNGSLYFPRPVSIEEQRSQHSEGAETSRGVCVPNLLNILAKLSRSKSH